MEVDIQAVEKKLEEKKPLTKEETEVLLKDEGVPDGYKPPLIDEETPPAAEPKAKEEAKAEKAEAPEAKPLVDEDVFLRLERELAKPDGQEVLTSFNEREKAYFFQMRRDRRGRQKAEEERDAALFRETQRKQAEKPAEKPKEEDPLEALNKKDPTDFLTVAEVKDLFTKIQAKSGKDDERPQAQIDPVRVKYLNMLDKEARTNHPDDYDAVMELTSEIINKNPKHQEAVAQALVSGENVAETIYSLIKGDPAFAELFPVAKTKVEARKQLEKPKAEKSPEAIKKESEAKKAEDALEQNKDKVKTTGHAGVGEGKPAEEMTMEEIAKMSDKAFAKLPKKTRQRYLEMYG